MTSIVDYRHAQYYFNGVIFSFSDFFSSADWLHYLSHPSLPMPLYEGVRLLVRFAETTKKFHVDLALFSAIVSGEVKEGIAFDALETWKKHDRSDELKRLGVMDKFLRKNRSYPYILFPLFNQRYSSTEKAQQLYSTMDIWYEMKRPFFALVFKYAKRLGAQIDVEPDMHVSTKRDRKGKDPLYQIYLDASNALWAYSEYLNGKIEIVGRRGKKREGSIFNAIELENEWIEWMGKDGNWVPLLEYHRAVVTKQRERARFTLLMEFLMLHLKGENLDNAAPTHRGNTREQHLKIQKVHK